MRCKMHPREVQSRMPVEKTNLAKSRESKLNQSGIKMFHKNYQTEKKTNDLTQLRQDNNV